MSEIFFVLQKVLHKNDFGGEGSFHFDVQICLTLELFNFLLLVYSSCCSWSV